MSEGPERRDRTGSPVRGIPVAPGPNGQEDRITFLDLAAVGLRWRWVIVPVTVIVTAVVVVATLMESRTWTATASFMPQTSEAAQSRLAGIAGQFGVDIGGQSVGQSPEFYAGLIRSREILRSVVNDTFDIVDANVFPEGAGPTTLIDLRDPQSDRPEQREAAAMRWLRDAISVSTNTQTGLVQISVRSRSPSLSSGIAARLLEEVNDFNLENRQSQAAAERRFVEERLEETRVELREAENALQSFLQRNRQVQNSPELMFERDRLQRQVSMRQDIYTSLVQSYEQARIGEVRNTPVITIVERAEEPVRPDSRRLPFRAVLGLLVGGILGTTLAFGGEYVRRQRVDDPEDLEEFSKLWEETKADFRGAFRRLQRS